MNVMEYYCFVKKDERDSFREIWEDVYEFIQVGRIRTIYILTTCKRNKNKVFQRFKNYGQCNDQP